MPNSAPKRICRGVDVGRWSNWGSRSGDSKRTAQAAPEWKKATFVPAQRCQKQQEQALRKKLALALRPADDHVDAEASCSSSSNLVVRETLFTKPTNTSGRPAGNHGVHAPSKKSDIEDKKKTTPMPSNGTNTSLSLLNTSRQPPASSSKRCRGVKEEDTGESGERVDKKRPKITVVRFTSNSPPLIPLDSRSTTPSSFSSTPPFSLPTTPLSPPALPLFADMDTKLSLEKNAFPSSDLSNPALSPSASFSSSFDDQPSVFCPDFFWAARQSKLVKKEEMAAQQVVVKREEDV